jgi:hypothetical protein
VSFPVVAGALLVWCETPIVEVPVYSNADLPCDVKYIETGDSVLVVVSVSDSLVNRRSDEALWRAQAPFSTGAIVGRPVDENEIVFSFTTAADSVWNCKLVFFGLATECRKQLWYNVYLGAFMPGVGNAPDSKAFAKRTVDEANALANGWEQRKFLSEAPGVTGYSGSSSSDDYIVTFFDGSSARVLKAPER